MQKRSLQPKRAVGDGMEVGSPTMRDSQQSSPAQGAMPQRDRRRGKTAKDRRGEIAQEDNADIAKNLMEETNIKTGRRMEQNLNQKTVLRLC
eukprot:SAG11_NODE_13971_length_631_cov_0.520677_1_plen_92_part_00